MKSPDREVSQSDVLELIQITESKECKKLASGGIGRTFGPAVQFSRRKKVYQNIRKRISYSLPIDCEYSQLQIDSRSRIGKLKVQIAVCFKAMDAWENEIHSTCEADKPDIGYLKTLIRFYENEDQKFASYHERLDELYEKEMSDLIYINGPYKLPSSLNVELERNITF